MGSSIVFLGDQFPMPSQQGLGSDNAGDLGQYLSSQRFGLYGQSPALMVIEAHSPVTELFSKRPILLAKVVNDLQLAVVHPPGNSDQHKPERVDPSLRFQNPLSQPWSRSTEPPHLHADPVFGPYGVSPRTVESYLRDGGPARTPDPKQRWLTFIHNMPTSSWPVTSSSLSQLLF